MIDLSRKEWSLIQHAIDEFIIDCESLNGMVPIPDELPEMEELAHKLQEFLMIKK